MCILTVSNKTKSFKEFLATTSLPYYTVYEKGEKSDIPSIKSAYVRYGFSCDVSDRPWDDLDGQIRDSIRFMKKYAHEFKKLRRQYRGLDIDFSFPYYCRLSERVVAQYDDFPPEFLTLAGRLGIGLELGLYRSTEPMRKRKKGRPQR